MSAPFDTPPPRREELEGRLEELDARGRDERYGVAMGAGVTCAHCGGSTPLPDDLRVPQFACRYCEARLDTARYAGKVASADAHVGWVAGLVDGEADGAAPQLADIGTDAVRADTCRRCGAAVDVPLSVYVRAFRCTGCHAELLVDDYVSHDERFELEQKRSAELTVAVKEVQERGLDCHNCGATNPCPPPHLAQTNCASCGTVLLLSSYLPEDAVTHARLGHGAAALTAKQARGCALQLGIGAAAVLFAVVTFLVWWTW